MERFKNFKRLEDALTGDIILPETGRIEVELSLDDLHNKDEVSELLFRR